MNKAEKLRDLFAQKPILKVMGAHHALGAKLIERSGFDGVWASGFEIATAHGVPDANILTMTEHLDAAIQMNSATQLPVICDCDTGYGNANNVMHMVRKYESAGIAAVVIEDKRFPKINSFIPGRQELASIEEFVGKIKAAKAAQVLPGRGMMIFARIEALIAGWSMEEALKRARAYREAGADGIVIHSKLSTPDQIFEFASHWKFRDCPLVVIPTTYPGVTIDQLAGAGCRMVIYANHGIRASVRAMIDVFHQIYEEGSSLAVEDKIASMEELFQLQGMPSYQEQEERFGEEQQKISAVIPAAGDHQFQPELSSLLRDRPLCMLELDGKPILERQIEILRSIGVRDVTAVTGYQKEKILVKGVQLVENIHFQTMKSAHSVMCGLSRLKSAGGKTIVCYSDIIFDRQIPAELIQSPYPITLVIDRAFRSLPRRDKSLDLVVTTDDPSASRRMQTGKFKRIRWIGKQKMAHEADHEFIGMFFLTSEGLDQIKAAWARAQKEFGERQPFYEASSVSQASVTDLFQYAIDKCLCDMSGLVIEHGWSEVYSLEDYERLDRYFAQRSAKPIPVSS